MVPLMRGETIPLPSPFRFGPIKWRGRSDDWLCPSEVSERSFHSRADHFARLCVDRQGFRHLSEMLPYVHLAKTVEHEWSDPDHEFDSLPPDCKEARWTPRGEIPRWRILSTEDLPEHYYLTLIEDQGQQYRLLASYK